MMDPITTRERRMNVLVVKKEKSTSEQRGQEKRHHRSAFINLQCSRCYCIAMARACHYNSVGELMEYCCEWLR
ncbi:uncharacterized [Tachysurus ichikawai]